MARISYDQLHWQNTVVTQRGGEIAQNLIITMIMVVTEVILTAVALHTEAIIILMLAVLTS